LFRREKRHEPSSTRWLTIRVDWRSSGEDPQKIFRVVSRITTRRHGGKRAPEKASLAQDYHENKDPLSAVSKYDRSFVRTARHGPAQRDASRPKTRHSKARLPCPDDLKILHLEERDPLPPVKNRSYSEPHNREGRAFRKLNSWSC